MKLRSLIVAVASAIAIPAFLPVAMQAQTGLYLNPIAQRISLSTADHGTFAFLGDGVTSRMFYGVNMGAYYDFKTPYPFHAGLDIRDSIMHGNDASLNNFLVGIRISGRPFRNQAWKPYVEPVIGAGTSEAPATATHVTKFEYGAYAGLDYATHHHIDFRVVELGFSGLRTASSGTIGDSASVPAATIISISTGFVFRFP
jgi:hypothetical protein